MKLRDFLLGLSGILAIQGCTTTPEERRVKNLQSMLRTACVSSSSSEIGLKIIGNGEYELSINSMTGDADVKIDASVFSKTDEGANYINEVLKAAQDDSIRECIYKQWPRIVDELRTPTQKSAKCYRDKTEEFVAKETFKTNEQSARADGPGWRGGRNRDSAELCYGGIQGYDKIEVNFRRTSCLGGRCEVGTINTNVTNGKATACVHMTAWSESASFGAGGRVGGYLYGSVSKSLTDSHKEKIRQECEARYNMQSEIS